MSTPYIFSAIGLWSRKEFTPDNKIPQPGMRNNKKYAVN